MNLREVGLGPEGQVVCWEGQREYPLSEIHPPGGHNWAFGLGLPSPQPDRMEGSLMVLWVKGGDRPQSLPLH